MKIEPMLASPIDWDRIADKAGGYWMEPKLDGVRCIADVRDPAHVKLTSRGGKDLTPKLPHITKQLGEQWPGCILDGELGYMVNDYAIDFNTTMRVLGSGVTVAITKQNNIHSVSGDLIKLNIFDLLWDNVCPDMHLYNWNARLRRERLIHRAEPHLFVDTGHILLVPRIEHWDEGFYNHVVDHQGEGVILKNPLAPYLPGQRRAQTWYKVKKFETVDAVVVGYTSGQGKYEDLVGAIEFETADGGRGKCSGMDDATRLEISCDQARYLGKAFELRYFDKVGKDKGGYRFPQFLKWRT